MPKTDCPPPGADESPEADKPAAPLRSAPHQVLRSTALLPALFTLSNALCGFGAVHFACKDLLGAADFRNLMIAGWLIIGAMVCDMLDGRVARFARRTSDFGGQLDSLADAISFGVAPAMLMLRAVVTVLRQQGHYPTIEHVVWWVAAAYMACAVLRLARFNVENEPGPSAHMHFEGLPSPGAAAAITALVMLVADLALRGWINRMWLLPTTCIVLPVLTLTVAILMVSRLQYPHVVNQYIHGQRSFGYLIRLLAIALAVIVVLPSASFALLAFLYAMWGPMRAGRDWLSRRQSRQAT